MFDMIAIREVFVFLLVAIVEPPSDVSSGIETTSTGRNFGCSWSFD